MKKKWDRKLRGGDEEEDEEEEGDVDVGGRARNNNIWAAWSLEVSIFDVSRLRRCWGIEKNEEKNGIGN